MAGALHNPDVVLVSTRAGSVLLADVALKKVEFASECGHSETIFDAAFHPADPFQLFTVAFDGMLKHWDTRTAALVRQATPEGGAAKLHGLSFSSPRAPVAPDKGYKVCSCSHAGKIYIWEEKTLNLVATVEAHTGHCTSVREPYSWILFCTFA